MNEIARAPARATTRIADGWPRIMWTHQDLDRMVEAGLLREDDHVELVGGEIVPMSPKGNRHEPLRHRLTDFMYRRLPGNLLLMNEPGWRPEPHSYFEPDLLIVPAVISGMEIPAPQVRLLIEIADTSFGYDTSVKRDAYARLGVREYWVIHAARLETRVYRDPSAAGFASEETLKQAELITPTLVPEVAVRLRDLRLT